VIGVSADQEGKQQRSGVPAVKSGISSFLLECDPFLRLGVRGAGRAGQADRGTVPLSNCQLFKKILFPRTLCSEMLRRVALVRTDVSEERITTITRLEGMSMQQQQPKHTARNFGQSVSSQRASVASYC
jgi:hypothetical protein